MVDQIPSEVCEVSRDLKILSTSSQEGTSSESEILTHGKQTVKIPIQENFPRLFQVLIYLNFYLDRYLCIILIIYHSVFSESVAELN